MEQRLVLKEELRYPEMGKDYEPYEYNISHMGEKFNVGVHNEEFKKVATKIKEKERFDTDTDPWNSKFW